MTSIICLSAGVEIRIPNSLPLVYRPLPNYYISAPLPLVLEDDELTSCCCYQFLNQS
jgi:hypothetical protein